MTTLIIGGVVAAVLILFLVQSLGFLRTALIGLVLTSTLSLATELPFIFAMKYARLVITVAICAFGFYVWLERRHPLGRIATLWLLAVGVFVLAALWSSYPVRASLYKGLTMMLVLGGTLVGTQQRNLAETLENVKTIYLAFLVTCLVIFVGFLGSGGFGGFGRLSVFGINPIGIGESAAFLIGAALVCVFTTRGGWKTSAAAAICLSVLIILLTGSRGAAVGAVILVVVCLAPSLKRSLLPLLALVGVAVLIVFLLPDQANNDSVSRLSNLDVGDRSSFWYHHLAKFYANPLIGVGWFEQDLFGQLSWGQTHSVYVTVLVESGIVGGLPWLVFMFILAKYAMEWGLRDRLRQDLSAYLGAFCFGLIAYFAFKGLIESGPIFGTTAFPFLTSYAIGTLSRAEAVTRERGAAS